MRELTIAIVVAWAIYSFQHRDERTLYPVDGSRESVRVDVGTQRVTELIEDGLVRPLPNCQVFNGDNWQCRSDDLLYRMAGGTYSQYEIAPDRFEPVPHTTAWRWWLGRILTLAERDEKKVHIRRESVASFGWKEISSSVLGISFYIGLVVLYQWLKRANYLPAWLRIDARPAKP